MVGPYVKIFSVILALFISIHGGEMLEMLALKFSHTLVIFAITATRGICQCQLPHPSESSTSIDGKRFPALIDATLEDLIWGLDTGLFTSVDLTNAYAARILEVNSTLRMVTELNPDAPSIAAALDVEHAQGISRGPLHGIPILIKNNMATDDKMNNTVGSYALLGSKVPSDSTVAAKLRKAGAVLLGKTNLSQWANYRSDNTSNGWSSHGGQTEGAYYPGQDPSGSSSGSGVASSLGLALGCLGTETDGSILSPSNQNNIVGIKPSMGLTSRYLVVPISEHQDTVGPMARTVKDAAYILSAIAGRDANDNYTFAISSAKTPNYEEACKIDALRGKRIGVPRNLIDLTDQEYYAPVIQVFDGALDVLREAGATVVDNITLPGYEILKQTNDIILEADFITNLPKYLSKLVVNPHNIKNAADLQNFTHSFPLEDWPQRDTLIWKGAIELGYSNDSPLFCSNYTANLHSAGLLGITGALQNYSLDALVIPTPFSPHLPALIGAPVVTVPLGALPLNTTVKLNSFGNLNASAPNLPYGISFMGERFDEYNLIGLAYAFEHRTLARNRIKPYLEPTTELANVVHQRKAASLKVTLWKRMFSDSCKAA